VQEYIKKAGQKVRPRADHGRREGRRLQRASTLTNPLNGDKVPPLGGGPTSWAYYGTGVVMGVPAHDTRDFRLREENTGLPVKIVISGGQEPYADAYVGEGKMINSGELTGDAVPRPAFRRSSSTSRKKGLGRPKTKLQAQGLVDLAAAATWGLSDPDHPLPERRRGAGPREGPSGRPAPRGKLPAEGPFAAGPTIRSFMNHDVPQVRRFPRSATPDTMDTFMCSTWYLYRYVDAKKNTQEPLEQGRDPEVAAGGPVHRRRRAHQHAPALLPLHREGASLTREWVADGRAGDQSVPPGGWCCDEKGDNHVQVEGQCDFALGDHGRVGRRRLSPSPMFAFAPSDIDIKWKAGRSDERAHRLVTRPSGDFLRNAGA